MTSRVADMDMVVDNQHAPQAALRATSEELIERKGNSKERRTDARHNFGRIAWPHRQQQHARQHTAILDVLSSCPSPYLSAF